MRQLTNPITNQTADKQYVQSGHYELVLNSNNGINLEKSFYQYTVMNLPSRVVSHKKVFAVDMPQAFRAKLKELHQMVVTDAENSGLLLPGTDTDDL